MPRQANESPIVNKLINARLETVTEKPSFRETFARTVLRVVAAGRP